MELKPDKCRWGVLRHNSLNRTNNGIETKQIRQTDAYVLYLLIAPIMELKPLTLYLISQMMGALNRTNNGIEITSLKPALYRV